MSLPVNGYVQQVEVVVGGTLPRAGFVQPVESSGAAGLVTGSGVDGQVTFWTGAQTVSGSASLTWDNANLFQTNTSTLGKQLRLAYSGAHYVDFTVGDTAAGYNTVFTITPTTQAFPNAFCEWRMQGSDFCMSYEGDDVNGFGVPNLTIRGPASSGYPASSGPGFNLYNNKSALDSKLWSMYLNDTVLTFSAVNDANNVVTNWLTVSRSGSTVGQVAFPTFLNLGGSTFGANTGDIGVNGQVLVKNGSASSPGLSFGNLTSTGFYCIPASGGDIDVTIAGTTYFRMLGNAMRMGSGVVFGWASGDPTVTGMDTSFSRVGASILTGPAEIRFTNTNYLSCLYNGTDGIVSTSSGDLYLNPAGNVKFGTFAAAAGETFNGTIQIKDAGGTLRKVAVFA